MVSLFKELPSSNIAYIQSYIPPHSLSVVFSILKIPIN
nr:MAG TPA: hypothetical protein [Caudoviricetes sp.]